MKKTEAKIHLKLKATLLNEEGEAFLGAGPYRLLRRIEKSHSISEAAREMNLSYAKAHRLVRNLETNTGRKVLKTCIGGAEHGGAILTPFGRALLSHFEEFLAGIEEDAQRRFKPLKNFLSRREEKEQ